ncbi:MAG: GGDEF domain-containing protein [Treponema sp.]|nr:GGDEF domain-containing protein [Treponema sp.]
MDESSIDILTQFQHLQQSGMLASLEDLKRENRELKRIISDMQLLVSYTNVESMLTFLITKFLDYFIPQTLVFIVKPPRNDSLKQYYFRRLKKTRDSINESCFNELKNFFDTHTDTYHSGEAVAFKSIEKVFPSNTFDSDFISLHPNLIIPLTGIGGVYGIIIMTDKIVGNEYTENELDYMQRMFSIFAITMQNELHYETSITDPKTGLFTYDYFVKRIQEKIASARRHNTNSAMLMLDIDHFKHFNDTYGHLAGDKVLVALSQTLQRIVREEDCVARFGGEEFSILLSDCDPDSLFLVAERIRRTVAGIELYEKDQKLQITVSIGGCMIEALKGVTPKYIFKRSDQALYFSKENGRNRSTIFSIGLLDRVLMDIQSGE